MSVFSSGTFIKNRSKGFTHLLFILLVSSLVVIVSGQSRWQDVTAFHPYCVRLFKGCVESSSTGGVGSGDYNVAVGICGNKMAICTFSGSLAWPWSSSNSISAERPASAPTSASSSQLTMYRNILASPATVTATPWQNLTAFLPDCREAFLHCVNTQGGAWQDTVTGVCGHGMSVCSERQGRWPYGNDSSEFWQEPYTSVRLTLYRNVYNRNFDNARHWGSLTVFLPMCQNLMAQCVSTSRDPSSNNTIGLCGNRMAICTFDNILWPHSYIAWPEYTDSYDARWQRYANIFNPISRWQDLTRFSFRCSDRFFACVYASANVTDDEVIGVCGNQMSLCTFNNSVWPNANQVPTTPDSYSTRLSIYRALLENMLPAATTYLTFPPLYWELYPFTAHTFTNAGATGRFGPTDSQCRSAYSSQPWVQNSSFFSVWVFQEWTVPATGPYRIICAGAQGGNSSATTLGGRGAQMIGEFDLVAGQNLKIVVGQAGSKGHPCSTSGGGGSFVWNSRNETEPLIAAGGGGGAGTGANGSPGTTTTAGTGTSTGRTAGSNGMGATPGGAGWKSDGGSAGSSNLECLRPMMGATGGRLSEGADGGFGGGATGPNARSGYPNCADAGGEGAGGGGGYSGGAGPTTTRTTVGGGGGGSYNSGRNQQNSAGVRSGHGFVTINKLFQRPAGLW